MTFIFEIETADGELDLDYIKIDAATLAEARPQFSAYAKAREASENIKICLERVTA